MNFKKVKSFFYSNNSVMNDDIEKSNNFSEFDALFNNELQSILIVDSDARILKMNKKFLSSLNTIKNTSIEIGSSVYEVISTENQERFTQDFNIALSGKKAIHERWLKDVYGNDFCFVYEYTPIKKDGKVSSVLMTILDITSLRATNKIINSHEQQYLALVDGHHSALFITRPDGTIINANDSAVDMFGYSKEEFLKITRHVFIDHEDPRLESYLKKRLEIGMVQGELVGIKKDGTRFPIEFSSVLFNNSITGELQTSTLVNDISYKKRDEKISKETNRVARVGGYEFDLTNNSLYWTDETKEIHEVDVDYTPDFNTAINFYAEGEHRTAVLNVFEEVIKTGKSYEGDFIIITAKGNEKWVRVKILVEMQEGKAIRMHGTFQDIDFQKKMILKLEQSEALLSAYFDSTFDVISVLGKNYELLGFNRTFENEVNIHLNKQVKLGDSIFNFLDKGNVEGFKNNYIKALNGEQIKTESIVRINNTDTWWEANYNPIYNNNKEVIGVAFSSKNIDSRKVFQVELIKSKNQIEKSLSELQHQRFALDQHALVNVTNNKGEIIYVNDKFAELSGYTKEQLLGNTHRLLKSNVHNDDFFKEMNETIHAGKVWNGDICNKKRDGDLYWLRMTVVPFKDHITNEITQFISICTDITEKREEETRLKLLESVITNANDAVIITEAEPITKPGPRIVYVNDAFTKMTGFTKEEVIGKSPRILQGPLSNRDELDKLSASLKKWEATEIEIINYKKNGQHFWVNFSVVPIADENGWFTHWISIQRDTTTRKKYEEERQHLIDELSSSINELKQFTYITSHNMRAPVTNLLGIFNILDTSTITDEFTLKLIDGLKKSTYNLNETLNDLIKILIIKENTNQSLKLVDFNESLENVKRSITSMLDNNDVGIDVNFNKANAVLFNKSYLESIFLNLITNSIRYAYPGRRVLISMESKTEKDFVKLIYKDNGLGMDMEKVRGQIFGLYKRFHNHPESKGVGLYLVHSQVTSLGGFIEVDSQVNIGTTFTISFKK